MTKRPDDETPEPPGGRAAERLREFIDARFPEGERPELPVDDAAGEDTTTGSAPSEEATEPGQPEPAPEPEAAPGEDPGATEEQEDGETSSKASVNPDP
jgi:hypothetical protein